MGRGRRDTVGSGGRRRLGRLCSPVTLLLVVGVGTALPATPPGSAAAASVTVERVRLPEDLPERIDARRLLVPDTTWVAQPDAAVVPPSGLLAVREAEPRAGAISVPGDYPTIQAAITAAATGDTIVVAPGTYEEDIDFEGKGIILESAAGPAVTVIQGTGTGPVVRIDSEEPAGTTLRGFTITGGYAQIAYGEDGAGGGIYVLGPAQAVIENNYITLNRAGGQGGGIAAVNSNFSTVPVVTEIRGNVIARNRAAAQAVAGNNGGGLYAMGESVIEGNTFVGNDGDGAYFRRGAMEVDGNEFSANRGSGIAVGLFTDAVAANNLMISNLSGLELLDGASSGFYNNTLVENGLSMSSDWNPGDFMFANNIIEPRGHRRHRLWSQEPGRPHVEQRRGRGSRLAVFGQLRPRSDRGAGEPGGRPGLPQPQRVRPAPGRVFGTHRPGTRRRRPGGRLPGPAPAGGRRCGHWRL